MIASVIYFPSHGYLTVCKYSTLTLSPTHSLEMCISRDKSKDTFLDTEGTFLEIEDAFLEIDDVLLENEDTF